MRTRTERKLRKRSGGAKTAAFLFTLLVFAFAAGWFALAGGGVAEVGAVAASAESVSGGGESLASKVTTFTNVIAPVRFSGEDEFIDSVCGGTATVRRILNDVYEGGEYSVKDYYARVSNGKIIMQNAFLFCADGSTATLSKSRGYYCEKTESNPDGYESYERAERLYELKTDWAAAISQAMKDGGRIVTLDGSKTLTAADLDKNGDGRLDGLAIVYPYSSAYSVGWSDCLWNYQDVYTGLAFGEGENAITSGNYLQFTANFGYLYTDSAGNKFPSLKTAIHETGHIFGLKDLYKSESNSPVYYMSAMSNALSPVPQYISAKEREALGWLDESNVREVAGAGTYTVNVTSSEVASGVVCYKFDLKSRDKTVYLEYRDFSGGANRYDVQAKDVYNASGEKVKGINIKSGLVCFLVDRGTRFPNNLSVVGSNWNYEVLRGQYATMTDAALGAGDERYITSSLSVKVTSVNANSLSFTLIGDDFANSHVHSASKVEAATSTCKKQGNIVYWRCSGCEKLFLDESLQSETTQAAVLLPLASHAPKTVKGYSATCTSTGLTDGEECSVCGAVLVAQKVIGKAAHRPSEWIVDKPPTPTEDGLRRKKCLDCGETLSTQPLKYSDTKPDGGDGGDGSTDNGNDGGANAGSGSGGSNGDLGGGNDGDLPIGGGNAGSGGELPNGGTINGAGESTAPRDDLIGGDLLGGGCENKTARELALALGSLTTLLAAAFLVFKK